MILPELDDYNWKNAFAYAKGFTLGDVARVEQKIEGENEGADWIIWGELRNRQWFCLKAGCDYTGWDCQASGASYTGTKEDVVRWGMDTNMRERFGIPLPDGGM